MEDWHGSQTNAGFQGDSDRLIDFSQLLQGDTEGQVVTAHATDFLGEWQTEQAHFAHLRDNLVRESVVAVVLGGNRVDNFVGKFANYFLQFHVFVVEDGGCNLGAFGHDECSLKIL